MSEQYDFMVCTRCKTYNHERFIEDAMNGFTMQQTTFPFVCTILDDASTDSEQEVIKKYLKEHFNLEDKSTVRNEETDDYILVFAQHKTNKNCYFAVLFLKYNHYSIKKPKAQYFKEWQDNTKYIALCEGDDYWTHPQKLQKQVEFMEVHPEYSMCYHAVNHVSNRETIGNDQRFERECDISTENIIEGGGGYCGTCSLFFRKDYISDFPKFRRIARVGDAPLQVLLAIRGKIRYFPTIMGTYRMDVPGSWTSRVWNKDLSRPYKNAIEWLLEFNKETGEQYEKSVLIRIYPYIKYLYNHHKIDKKEKRSILSHFSYKTIYNIIGKRGFIKYLLCLN